MTKELKLGLKFLTVLLLISGCASTSRINSSSSGNVERLISRPDALVAKKAAPEWCRDALMTINSLEYNIQTLEVKSNAK